MAAPTNPWYSPRSAAASQSTTGRPDAELVAVAKAGRRAVHKVASLWKLIGLLLVVGLVLVLIRAMVLGAIPWMQKHVKLVRDGVNVFLVIFTTIENIVNIVVGAVKELIHLFRPKKPTPIIHLHSYHTVTAAALVTELTGMAQVCPQLGNAYVITQRILQHVTATTLCPLLRALSVTPLRHVIEPTLGWASADYSNTSTTSCVLPDIPTDWVCIGLGGGFLVLEIALPLIVVPIVLIAVLPSVYNALVAYVLPLLTPRNYRCFDRLVDRWHEFKH